tara:strand:+ start:1696 stop:1968 length:273 start_codon:yes stop_codon:yes gene_type:complete
MKTGLFRDILLVSIGGCVGWYLAMNEEKAVRSALDKVKIQAIKLKQEIAEKIKENEQIQTQLDNIKTDYTGIVPPRTGGAPPQEAESYSG